MSGYTIDYSKYADKGFYISPFDQIEGETAIPIASVGITYQKGPSAEYKTYEDLLPEIVDRAISLGANGIFGLKMNASMEVNYITTATIDGVAVKITGKPASTFKRIAFNGDSLTNSQKPSDGLYNFAKAKASGRYYTRTKNGEKFYYDPDSKSYITRDEFLEKYEEWELERLDE